MLLCWIAGLIPLLGAQSPRVYYHCQITGELLPVCCCERADPPASATPAPPCCTSEAEQPVSRDEGLAQQDCDCCDVHVEQGRSEINARAESDTVARGLSTYGPSPVARTNIPLAIASPARERTWSEPPRRPFYILFESFRS